MNLEYKVDLKPKFNKDSNIFKRLNAIIRNNREEYRQNLNYFLSIKNEIELIKSTEKENNPSLPTWNNRFLPGLDIIGLYGMISKLKPKKYVEIGSGNSTKVARLAINNQKLDTHIQSIDPYPRAEIDALSDSILRKPFENLTDYDFLYDLNENDILFIDNSHRVLPNSDATVCFLEILPFLKPGVIVHFHDIYLPFDYPQFMCDRFYNEQYMLASFLVSNPQRYVPILPNFFISEDKDLSNLISPIWNHPNLSDVERHGGSFWLRIGE